MDLGILFQLFFAVFLGGILGLEREIKKREAGLQTYSLVCLGACIFTILGIQFFEVMGGKIGISISPLRIIEAVAVGIGFVGAGTIFRRKSFVEGVTTAAGLWVVAAIGVAIGIRLYLLAFFSAALSLLIFSGLGTLEAKFFPRENDKRHKRR